MNNMPEVKVGIVAVSRDCFPESLSVNRRMTQRYGVTAQRICQANPGLSAENFRIGQVIVIPAKVTDSEEIIMNEVKEQNHPFSAPAN